MAAPPDGVVVWADRTKQESHLAAPAAGGKRVDTCGFYPLDSRFPLLLSPAKIGERRPLRNRGTAVGLLLRVFLRLFAVHRQRTATHTGYSAQVRHNSAAQFFSAL